MPKMKSHSGASKRFKKTGTGKLRARSAYSSHILEKKTPKRKRGFRKARAVAEADVKRVNKLLEGGKK
jgi:large subunit ribosomal protein L35